MFTNGISTRFAVGAKLCVIAKGSVIKARTAPCATPDILFIESGGVVHIIETRELDYLVSLPNEMD